MPSEFSVGQYVWWVEADQKEPTTMRVCGGGVISCDEQTACITTMFPVDIREPYTPPDIGDSAPTVPTMTRLLFRPIERLWRDPVGADAYAIGMVHIAFSQCSPDRPPPRARLALHAGTVVEFDRPDWMVEVLDAWATEGFDYDESDDDDD